MLLRTLSNVAAFQLVVSKNIKSLRIIKSIIKIAGNITNKNQNLFPIILNKTNIFRIGIRDCHHFLHAFLNIFRKHITKNICTKIHIIILDNVIQRNKNDLYVFSISLA